MTTPYLIDPDGESTGPEGRYLLWYLDHDCRPGTESVKVCDSLEDALLWAYHKSTTASETPHSIEGPAGEIGTATMNGWIRAYHERVKEERRLQDEAMADKPLYRVMLRRLDGVEALVYDGYEDGAFEAARELGMADRVRIYTWDWGRWSDRRLVVDWGGVRVVPAGVES